MVSAFASHYAMRICLCNMHQLAPSEENKPGDRSALAVVLSKQSSSTVITIRLKLSGGMPHSTTDRLWPMAQLTVRVCCIAPLTIRLYSIAALTIKAWLDGRF